MSTAALFFDDAPSWSALEAPPPKVDAAADPAELLARAYAHVFGGPRGAMVLADLRAAVDVPLGPEYGDAYLRHYEGQRAIVRRICTMIERGRDQ